MSGYLIFSDAAKFADIARNIINGTGYVPSFSFFIEPYFTGMWIPPVMPYSLALFFKLFGVSDTSVLLASAFYFLITLPFVYLLGRKIFASKLVAVLSTIAVAFNNDLINYAKNGASESPFIFEIVLGTYLISLKRKWSNYVAILISVLMYFTRPHAFIFIAGMLLFYLILNHDFKKSLLYFGIFGLIGVLFDKLILSPLSGNYFIYSILNRGSNVLSQIQVSQSPSDQLRSGVLTYNFSILPVLKKLFYNLYNLYKLVPQIMSPYVFSLFIVSLFSFRKDNLIKAFTVATAFTLIATFVIVSASIPLYRYIHPVVPLVYIVAIGFLVTMLKNSVGKEKNNPLGLKKDFYVGMASTFCVLFFVVGQTLGVLLLDSRFVKRTKNVGKPPIYVVLSQYLKENTNKNDLVVTNLDTWGSWYGERRTLWYPLQPKQIFESTTPLQIDSIYLTGYLIDDENYYMDKEWRSIYLNPTDPGKWICEGCEEIKDNYQLSGTFQVSADENYEKIQTYAILLTRKSRSK